MDGRCKLYPDRGCWHCVESFREMIQRRATGANLHRLNNRIMNIISACEQRDVQAWQEAVRQFLHALKR